MPCMPRRRPSSTVTRNPSYGFAYGAAIVNWAKNPNAALVAQDFIMSVKGQAAIVGNGERAARCQASPGPWTCPRSTSS